MASGPQGAAEPVPAYVDEVLEAVDAAVWTVDFASGAVTTAGPYGTLLFGPGAPRDQVFADYETFLGVVHPDDLEAVRRAPRDAVQSGRFDQVFRVVGPDGRVRVISSRGHLLFNDARQPTGVRGILI